MKTLRSKRVRKQTTSPISHITLLYALLLLTACAHLTRADSPPATAPAAHPASFTLCEIPAIGHRVICVVDSSGSMLDVFDPIKAKLTKAVDAALPDCSIGAIFFGDKPNLIIKPMPATDANKAKFAEQIKPALAEGNNDDTLIPFVEAMQVAFKLHPSTIYLLTDGAFDPQLIARIHHMAADSGVHVDTIGFGQVDQKGEDRLKLVAKQNGGTYARSK